MNKQVVILCIIITFLFSCNKNDNEFRLSEFQTPVVTGFLLRDVTGSVIKEIGTPNVKLSDISNDQQMAKTSFVVYPNPSNHVIAITIESSSFMEAKIWVVRANYVEATSNYGDYLNSNTLIAGGSPVFYMESSSNTVLIDARHFEEGFYRIYVKRGDLLLWDNLIISKEII